MVVTVNVAAYAGVTPTELKVSVIKISKIETECISTQKALSAYLDEGCTLQQSAERGGVSQSELEDALRVMAAKQMKALPNFGTGRPKGSQRSYPLMPDEAKREWVASDSPVEVVMDGI